MKDIICEQKDGKRSSKRFWGTVENSIGLAMAICSGFAWYKVDTMLILTILGNGTLLLGFTMAEKFAKPKN